LCFNLILAPLVYAANGENFSKESAYAIGILLLIILALSIYLFWVIFQPERFYPLLILAIAQGILSFQANGSLIENDRGEVIGSSLIGQSFSSDKYFWSRPSSVNYSEGKDYEKTGISGASNLAPSNPSLEKQIAERISKLQFAKIKLTADLIYSSGSGLDPHISIEAARSQIERIVKNRKIDRSKLEQLK
jgi:potassium-transporting ATPase KdpC subunit